jgi:hypothetical protein
MIRMTRRLCFAQIARLFVRRDVVTFSIGGMNKLLCLSVG